MEYNVKLKDGRTVLVRPPRPGENVEHITEFMNELIADKAYLSLDTPQTIESESKWLEGTLKDMAEGKKLMLSVFLDGKYLGSADATAGSLKERDNVCLGIALSKKLQGQGLGRQLLTLLIAEAKNKWLGKRIWLTVEGPNARAKRLYEGMGFVEIACLKGWLNHHGAKVDKVFMELRE